MHSFVICSNIYDMSTLLKVRKMKNASKYYMAIKKLHRHEKPNTTFCRALMILIMPKQEDIKVHGYIQGKYINIQTNIYG